MLGALRVYKTLAELIPPAHEVKAEVCVCVLPHIHTLVPQPSIHVQVHSDTLQRLLLSMPDLKPLVGHSLARRPSQSCAPHTLWYSWMMRWLPFDRLHWLAAASSSASVVGSVCAGHQRRDEAAQKTATAL